MPSATSPAPATEWVASLSPWPEEFGLDRMRSLLERLGDPQNAYRAIHVVGTNGKSTATRTIAELLRGEGLRVGAYTSPHVSGWHERLDCDPASFERAVARVRDASQELGATQFEVLTAAALLDFAERDVEAAVVEAGLGGRLDATNVVDAEVVLLTNVGLEHTEVLGETREEIAREKLAVAHAARVVVRSDNTFDDLVPDDPHLVDGGAREAAEAFVGRAIERDPQIALPGRLEHRGGEIWDGAHTPEAVDWLLARVPVHDYALCVSILEDKRVDELLERLGKAGSTFVATRSSNARAIPAKELAARAEAHFSEVLALPNPQKALARARATGRPVIVTGSLYLLADLYA
jgi:dihydrofolate synthase/folylpolyglutamate synthase